VKGFRSQPIAARLPFAVLAILIWASSGVAQAQQAPKPPDGRQLVAVLDFEALGATKIEASAITDQVREGLLNGGAYRLVDRAQMDKVLEEQALQQQGCTTQECAVQVGKILGVRRLVTGKVTRVGSLWVLTATLIDVETAETLRAVSAQSEGAYRTALTEGSAALVAKLTERQQTAPAQPAAPAQPRDPRQGFSIRGGLGSESGTFKFKPAGSAKPKLQVAAPSGSTVARPTSGEAKVTATGAAIAGDYQWVLTPLWTITVFIEGFSGQVSGDLADIYDRAAGSNLGTEVRYWVAADKYVGGTLMVHGETLTPTSDAQSKHDLEPVSAGSGSAIGFVAGWEVRPRLTLGATLQVGSAKFANADYSYSVLRVNVAYRWPFPAGKP
jgi:TolB-like protein